MTSTPVPAPLPDGALQLVDWGVIRAVGPDSRSFLNGQLTQDMLNLGPNQARLAGYCSAKGRLLASFVVWSGADDELLLACSADLLPATLKRLSMYVMRAKCKLSDASAEHRLWGAVGNSARQSLGAHEVAPWQVVQDGASHVLRLPDAVLDGQPLLRCLIDRPTDSLAPALPSLDVGTWQALEARSGVARIVGATVEQFVPQMVNLELVGGVSFQKGCYPGQEVVARSQYRGTLKRRGFALSAAVPMQPGQEVFHSADPLQPAGLVALAGRLSEERYEALAELKLSATSGGSLHLGAAEGPTLQLAALPYALPLDNA